MTATTKPAGGFSFREYGADAGGEDEIHLLSVGVESDLHVASCLFLASCSRKDGQPTCRPRETFYETEILLTTYTDEETIDANGAFGVLRRPIRGGRRNPGNTIREPADLTGGGGKTEQLRAHRRPLRTRARSWWRSAAGDSLETIWPLRGGAVGRRSATGRTVMNVDCRRWNLRTIAVCQNGQYIVRSHRVHIGATDLRRPQAGSCG